MIPHLVDKVFGAIVFINKEKHFKSESKLLVIIIKI
jgi:hypothetical protein